MHFLLSRLLVCLALCLAVSANIHFDKSINTRYKLHIRQSDDDSGVNDPCTPLCTAGGCNNDGTCTLARRDLTATEFRDNNVSELAIVPNSLQKRTLAGLTVDNIGDYYLSVLRRSRKTYQLLAERGYESGSHNYAEQVAFADYSTQPFTIVSGARTGWLTGCSVVTIVSRKAVWMAHLWERYSWTRAPVFQNEILNFISGSGSTTAVGGAPDPNLFNTTADGASQTRVYIMHPCDDRIKSVGGCPDETSQRHPRYEDRLELMVQAIENRIPGLTRDQIIYYYYRPDRRDDVDVVYTTDFEGRALFQFDPQGIEGVDERPDWRLTYEAAIMTGRETMGDLDVTN